MSGDVVVDGFDERPTVALGSLCEMTVLRKIGSGQTH
jgi:hypothetical protein